MVLYLDYLLPFSSQYVIDKIKEQDTNEKQRRPMVQTIEIIT